MEDFLTPMQREALIEMLMEKPILQDAALRLEVPYAKLMKYLLWTSEKDPGYYEKFEDAYKLGRITAGEDAIVQRAVYGEEDIVLHQGAVVMIEGDDGQLVPLKKRTKSDTLLTFMAKADQPGKYGDKVEIDHKGAGGAIILAPSAEEFEQMRKALKEQHQADVKESKTAKVGV